MKCEQALERLRVVIRRQHKALATEESYVFWVRRYIHSLRTLSPGLTSEKKFELFLTSLALRHNVAASTQNQAFNAVLYFYKEVLGQPLSNVDSLRAKRPVHERHAPSVADTCQLLQTIRNVGGYPTNLIARLLYGCGLRVCEPLNLRLKDINLERGTLCIRGAKGGDDRVVLLPQSVVPELTEQLRSARLVWQFDKQTRTPLMLPYRLAKKYPEYQFSWAWAWLFPAHHPCRDPRSGKIVRYRMHESNVQRAVKYARRQLGIAVLPHELRHSYATHSMDRGVSPRAIQEAMGHKSLETTMGYLHTEALSVLSPLDLLRLPPSPVGPSMGSAPGAGNRPAGRPNATFQPGFLSAKPVGLLPGRPVLKAEQL
jgi:integron integrase